MLSTLVTKAAGLLEAVARGLRSTVQPGPDWTETLNDVFYDDGMCDYDDLCCPICTYTAAAKGTDCEDCPLY